MASVFRKIVNARATKLRSKDSNASSVAEKTTAINKERDKLLKEFLTARDELKDQYDFEKREVVTNYERRLKYFRRLIEEYDENINMLKLNLDAEKEENYMLKTKLLRFENEAKKSRATLLVRNNSYEEEATLIDDRGSQIDTNQVDIKSIKKFSDYASLEHTRSSISGLKYSNKYKSLDSIGKSSFTSVTVESLMSDVFSIGFHEFHVDDENLHQNCRQEFNRLLEELCTQKKKFDEQLQFERERMAERIEDEKLQLERIVFRQLSLRLDKEIKKRELLYTENNHLRQTITQTALESLIGNFNSKKCSTLSEESNSDSGADVEYNHSDNESESLGQKQNTSEFAPYEDFSHLQQHDSISASLICSVLEEQKMRLTNDFQKQKSREQKKFRKIVEDLNQEIVTLIKENRHLKQQAHCYDDVSEFQVDLTKQLQALEGILTADDDDAC